MLFKLAAEGCFSAIAGFVQPIIPPDLREKPRRPVNSNVGRQYMPFFPTEGDEMSNNLIYRTLVPDAPLYRRTEGDEFRALFSRCAQSRIASYLKKQSFLACKNLRSSPPLADQLTEFSFVSPTGHQKTLTWRMHISQ